MDRIVPGGHCPLGVLAPPHQRVVPRGRIILGHIPLEPERWKRLDDFYLNSLRAVDLQMLAILKDLDTLRVAERPIVVVTTDHGEMAGAHGGMRGKGPSPPAPASRHARRALRLQ